MPVEPPKQLVGDLRFVQTGTPHDERAVADRVAFRATTDRESADAGPRAGANVGRAIRAREEGDQGRFDAAFDRALELLDLTLADPRWRGPRLREIARAREVLCDFLAGDNLYRSTPELLDAYFLAFAIAARRDR